MEKTVRKAKILKRYNKATMISSLLLFLMSVGVIASLAFLPLFKISYLSDGVITYQNVYLIGFFGQYLANIDFLNQFMIGFDLFKSIFVDNLGNLGISILPMIYTYGIWIFAGLSIIFSIIGLLTGLICFASGYIAGGWKAPKVISWFIFTFYFLLFVFVAFTHVITQIDTSKFIYEGMEIYDLNSSILIPCIALVLILIVSITIDLLYKKCLKHAIYYKDAIRIVNEKQKELFQKPSDEKLPEPEYIAPKVVETKADSKTKIEYDTSKGLPDGIAEIGDHAFSKNTELEVAIIPDGIEELGPSCFSNCINLRAVFIPKSIKKIGFNAFFGCQKLDKINYGGKKGDWKLIIRGSNWLASAGTKVVVCQDGSISVNPFH